MKISSLGSSAVLALLLVIRGVALASNAVHVESRTVEVGQQGVQVGVYITNDRDILAIDMPLEIRALVPGAFIRDSLSFEPHGRLAAWATEEGNYVFKLFFPSITYTDYATSRACPRDSLGRVWQTAGAPDFVSPDAILYVIAGIDSLPAGDDGQPGSGTPSALVAFDVADEPGQFVIDTTCTAPANHLEFVTDNPSTRVTPTFARGVITIIEPTDTLSGHVTTNTDLRGTVMLPGDLTVDSGVTVNVRRGTIFQAMANSDAEMSGLDSALTEIIVQGRLAIDSISGDRPVFCSTVDSAGTWYGIRIMPGGHLETGIGANIEDAVVGITVDSLAPADTLSKLTISDCSETGIHNWSGLVALRQDTVRGIPDGIGIVADSAAPKIESCVVESCGTGIEARFSSSVIRNTKIYGPGTYGVKIDDAIQLQMGFQSPELVQTASGEPGSSASNITLKCDTVSGYFLGAQLYMFSSSASCTVDSSAFVNPAGATRSTNGVTVGIGNSLTMHRSEVTGYSSYGVYSNHAQVALGQGDNPGNNTISTDSSGCGGCLLKRVYHNGFGTDTLKAEGNWWGTANPSSSWFSAKVDWNPYLSSPPSGKLSTPDEEDAQPAALPTDYSLSQNYPNPFNAGTVIDFSLTSAQSVEIKVYNVLGQVVKVLAEDEFAPGRHHVAWDGRSQSGAQLASGVYLYRIVAGDFVQTKKMVLLK